MNWRNPQKELPTQGQKVWVMLEPHKDRGDLLSSAMSIQIVCGEASYSTDGKLLEIQNYDELGKGAIGWSFEGSAFGDYQERAIGWVPVEEMFEKNNELERVTTEYQAYKTHYDKIFSTSVVVPTNEYAGLIAKLAVAEEALILGSESTDTYEGGVFWRETALAKIRGDLK